MGPKLTRRVFAVAAAVAAVMAVGASAGFAGQQDDGPQKGTERYTIGLFGDMPYNAYGKADCRPCSRTSTPAASRSRFTTGI